MDVADLAVLEQRRGDEQPVVGRLLDERDDRRQAARSPRRARRAAGRRAASRPRRRGPGAGSRSARAPGTRRGPRRSARASREQLVVARQVRVELARGAGAIWARAIRSGCTRRSLASSPVGRHDGIGRPGADGGELAALGRVRRGIRRRDEQLASSRPGRAAATSTGTAAAAASPPPGAPRRRPPGRLELLRGAVDLLGEVAGHLVAAARAPAAAGSSVAQLLRVAEPLAQPAAGVEAAARRRVDRRRARRP